MQLSPVTNLFDGAPTLGQVEHDVLPNSGPRPVDDPRLARDALRFLERDVLERWRIALSDADTTQVGELVHTAHAIRGALRTMMPSGGFLAASETESETPLK